MSIRENPRKVPIKTIEEEFNLCVPFIEQEMTNWCWAACACMVLSYYKVKLRQCALAAQGVNTSSVRCCSKITKPDCDQPLGTDAVTDLWHNNNINAKRIPSHIEVDELLEEIDKQKRPVELGYVSDFGGTLIGHLVLAVGWQKVSGQLSFLFHDPQNQARSSTAHNALLGRALGRVWQFTWINLDKPKP